MTRSACWLLASLGLLLLTACPHRRGNQPPETRRFVKPDELLAAMAQQTKRTQSIRAVGVVDMRRRGQRIKAHMVYTAQRPARLRFETESFFDQPISILVLDNTVFSIWDLNKGRFLRGPARPEHIARKLPVPMQPEAVVGLLMGEPPLIDFEQARIEWKKEKGLYLLTLSKDKRIEEILVDPISMHPMEAKVWTDGETYFTLKYKDWQGLLPRKVEFEMPGEKMKLKLRIKEVEVDPKLEDSLFRLTPPPGIAIEELE